MLIISFTLHSYFNRSTADCFKTAYTNVKSNKKQTACSSLLHKLTRPFASLF